MAETTNGGQTRLLWWIMGIFGAIILAATTLILGHIDRIETRTTLLEIANGKVELQIKQNADAILAASQIQAQSLLVLQAINIRLTLIERTAAQLEERVRIFQGSPRIFVAPPPATSAAPE